MPQVELDDETYDLVVALAAQHGISLAEAVQLAMEPARTRTAGEIEPE